METLSKVTRTAPTAWSISEILGRFQNASNATLLAVTDTGRRVVYKPDLGQRPLHDFDSLTLPTREILTFEVARAAQLDCVPETAPAEGPFGPGSAQAFVDSGPGFDPAPLINEADPSLWPIVTLDLVINNADRKAGHILADRSDRIWCIDHGLALHAAPKLRTVLWNFAGLTLPDAMVECLDHLHEALGTRLHERVANLLSPSEAIALAERVATLRHEPVHPFPPTDRPPVPWPVW